MSPRQLSLTILLWWILNTIESLLTTNQFNETWRTANWAIFCKYLRFLELTMLQFLIGGVAITLWLKLYLKRPLYPENLNGKYVALVVFGNLVGSLALNATYFMRTWHIQGIIGQWQPVVVFLLLAIIKYRTTNRHTSLLVLVAIAMAGSCVYTNLGKSYNLWGVRVAVLSAIAFPLRNICLKSFGDSWQDPLQKYSVMSICGFLILLPIVLVKLAYTRIFPVLDPKMLLESTLFQFLNILTSISVLQNISPLFHSVLGITIQLFVTLVTFMYLHIWPSWTMFTGLTVFVLGLIFYNIKANTTKRWKDLKKNIIYVVLAFYVIFSAYFFLGFTTKSTLSTVQSNSSSLFRTFWVHDRPLPGKVLLNIQTLQAKVPTARVHVYCATFRCMEKIRRTQNPKILTSFLTFNDILQNSPLERWFSRHPLHKVLSGKYFENHLHEAVRLALLWYYGGTYLDPFLRIEDVPVQEFNYHYPWVSVISDKKSLGILYACNFPPQHPFIRILSKVFVTQYSKATYGSDNSRKFLANFQNASFKAFLSFCDERKKNCPKTVVIKSSKFLLKKSNERHHFGIFSEIVPGIEIFANVQFFPFLDIFPGNGQYDTTTINYNTTAFVNTAWKDNTRGFHEIIDPLISSVSIDFRKKPSQEHVEFYRRRAPIGCRDLETVNFFRRNGIEAYLSGGISLLVKSQYLSRIPRKNVYLVDVDDKIREQLPFNIQHNGILLEYTNKEMFKLNRRRWFRTAYGLIEKYASARLVITQNVQCAFVATAMGTPVLFIDTSSMSENSFPRNLSIRQQPEIFHVLNLTQLSTKSIMQLILNATVKISPNPNPSLFMRLRATAWNAVRKRESLRESALRFGVVPFPLPDFNPKSNLTFHLIFTTSNRNSINLEGRNIGNVSTVKGGFVWRHWRCIEAVFYHHPFARVIIHSNTLSQATFDVLTEAGYDLNVRSYSLPDLAKGTPAEVFVRDELPYAKEGEHWYSHETDLLRLLILFKWGGIYMDTDIIVVRSLDDLPHNILGWESALNMNGAFMKFEKGHSFLEACLRKFSNHYSHAWAENGPLLLSRVWRQWSGKDNKMLRKKSGSNLVESDVTAAPSQAFYMFFYRTIVYKCFEDTSGGIFNFHWRVLRNEAYVVHLYSKVTAGYGTRDKIKEGTLCKHILNSFCVLCNRIY